MLVALVSSKGSPGASTAALALALVWPRPVILAELDPRGGDVLWGYGRGQNVGAGGLLRLQVAARGSAMSGAAWNAILWKEVVELPPQNQQKWFLPGLLGPREAGSVNWSSVVRALTSVDEVDVIADCGSAFGDREQQVPRAVWTAADLVALAVQPSLLGVQVARNAADLLREDLMTGGLGTDRLVSFVVQRPRGYPVSAVGKELSGVAPLLKQSVEFDAATAEVLGGRRDQSSRFVKSSLMQSAVKLAAELGGRAQQMSRPHRQGAAESLSPAGLLSVRAGEVRAVSLPQVGSVVSVVPLIPAVGVLRERGLAPVTARPIAVPAEAVSRHGDVTQAQEGSVQ